MAVSAGTHGVIGTDTMVALLKKIYALVIRRGFLLDNWWQRQAWPMRLYSSGGIVMAAATILALIQLNLWDLPGTIFLLGALLLAGGIGLKGYKIADKVLATRPGKVVAALVATMIGVLAMGISSVIVNEATGFPPGEFPYTVTFLAPLTAGYIILFVTIFLFIVALLVILAASLISIWGARKIKGEAERPPMLMLARTTAAVVLFALVFAGWERQHRSYEESLSLLAGWFALTFEMYGNDPCVRTGGERVRRVDAGDILVGYAQHGRRTFSTRRCEVNALKYAMSIAPHSPFLR